MGEFLRPSDSLQSREVSLILLVAAPNDLRAMRRAVSNTPGASITVFSNNTPDEITIAAKAFAKSVAGKYDEPQRWEDEARMVLLGAAEVPSGRVVQITVEALSRDVPPDLGSFWRNYYTEIDVPEKKR